mmetsp:Transcript_764/g.1753  ORF Transcript_764/g.1753 Transcript_764/m.1753 type:complete len:160 (+) Transcript_764:847-1326(+)|eukprot:CAMPEP_0114451540 /NCGR_PEP_ID=MMETSP0104-20121206/1038_1 /TAXON_ID=37642 ORGANISM="Paraphysomonas imperforata, Strain PA2" /NCGR_SAMPLE_ID=MMETSP0104 /ASSEMBLY_ACC=CAM_ASM_000202 /LENGTH=159 /DNA_ID=CAMNT_0001623735 /DNA_START=833 /DNA_END=1312 /DNA_ORIENTATION=-
MKVELDQLLLCEEPEEEEAKAEGTEECEASRKSKKAPAINRAKSGADGSAGGSNAVSGHMRARTLASSSHSLSLETLYEADERHGSYFRKQQEPGDKGEMDMAGGLWSGGSQRWAWSTSTDTSDGEAASHLVQVSLDDEDDNEHDGNEESSLARRQMSL